MIFWGSSSNLVVSFLLLIESNSVFGRVSPLFVVDKKANIQAFDQKGIQRNKEVKSVLNELKHSVFKAQDFSRPKLCFNATLKLVL